MIELIQSSTIHGINHIYSASNKCFKLLWIALFLFGIIGIIVNIIFIVLRYLSNPVLLSYTLDHENFIWPDITFCNPTAPYSFKDSGANNHWKEIMKRSSKVVKLLVNQTDVFKIKKEMEIKDFEFEERTIAMSSVNPRKFIANDLLYLVSSFTYTAAHTGLVYLLDLPRNSPTLVDKDLTTMFNTQFIQLRNNIPCHTFQIKRFQLANQNSIETLNFWLNFNYESYLIFNSTYYERSIFLYLTNNYELPQNNPIILYPGFTNTITLSQSRYHYHNKKRNCRKNNFTIELYDSILQSTQLFEGDFEDCKKIESQKTFVSTCKCYSPFLPIYKNQSGFPRICLNASFYSENEIIENANCMVRVYRYYQKTGSFEQKLKSKCFQYKYFKCDRISYKINTDKVLYLDFWTKASNKRRNDQIKSFYKTFFRTPPNSTDFRKLLRDNLLELIIRRDRIFGDYYKEEYEYPFSELLSDIGGLMGLWLGMSVVGLFEIGEFFYLYLQIVCCKPKRIPKSRHNSV